MKLTDEQDGKLQDLACMTVVDTAAEYYEHNERLSEFVQSLLDSAYEAGRREREAKEAAAAACKHSTDHQVGRKTICDDCGVELFWF
jgi:hypothetical protein